MKQILKIATLLLVLLAMTGMASAAIDPITTPITPILSTVLSADGINYNFTVGWTGTDEGTVTIKISPGSIPDSPVPFSPSSKDFSVPLIPGTTYTVNVSDASSSQEITFTTPAYLTEPTITDFKSLDTSSNPNLDLSWQWTSSSGEILQIYDGTNWVNLTTNTATFPGNPTLNTNVVFRTISADSYSNNTTPIIFKPVTFASNSTTSNSITWTLGNDWPKYANYSVVGSVSGAVASSDLSYVEADRNVTASNLNPGEDYTLTIRGFDDSTGGLGYSLFNSSPAVPLVIESILNKTAMTNFFDSGNPKDLSIENTTLFSLKAVTNNTSSFKWELNKTGDTSFTNIKKIDVTSAKEDTFNWTPDKLGAYTLKLIVNDGTNEQTVTWNITVTERSSGNRIWSDGMPTTYTWNARSFAGFYYDLDTGEGSEQMTIKNIGRSLDKNSITYTTKTSNVTYAYDPWQTYQIVGFMGDKYYAGSGSDSLMKNGNLSKVLVDSDESKSYRVGQYIALEEGYSVKIQQLDIKGNQAWLVIEKDGKEVASGSVSSGSGSGSTFIYEANLSKTKVPLIRVHVKSVFMGTESSLLEIDGLFQISDKLTKLESGTKIDKMEITGVSGDTIEMTNSERVSLSQDSEVTLMGKMKFIVADNSTLKFAPTIEYTDPGIYEIRGTVSDFSNPNYIVYNWTPQNFEGFYYNIDDDIGSSESIKINQTLSDSNRRIDRHNLTYTANATEVNYNYSGWTNKYSVVGFMGEKYYAGVGGSLLKGGNLSKVLIDGDEKRNIYSGQYITLEEGYSIKVSELDVNGNRALFILEKDGKVIDSGSPVSGGSDYIYEKKIGSGSGIRVEFIRLHVDSVFMGTESSLVTVSGLFQVSENLTKVENGAKYGKMEVDSYSDKGIILSNDDSISLSSGNDVEFMKVGNQSMYFKVGDNSTLRFAPVVEREIGSTTPLEVKVDPSEVEVGSKVNVTVMDRGTTIEGVTVIANGSTVGTTNSSGMIEYTTNSVGTIKITGEKPGYVNGSTSLTVKEKSLNMTISVSPEPLYFGTSGTIKVTDALNGSAVSGVSILVGNASAGTTGSNGELSYTFNTTGDVTIQGSKTGYINSTKSVFITQKDVFNYSNFTMKPNPLAAKSNTKLSFEAVNVGIEEGSHTLKLVVKDNNGAVISETTNDVSLKVGADKKVTFSFKPPAEGNYRLELTETDSNRVIDLSSMSSISVGPAKMFGSTILYIILAILAVILLIIIGVVAYLFGVKGATRHNYKDVAGNIVDDVKTRFRR